VSFFLNLWSVRGKKYRNQFKFTEKEKFKKFRQICVGLSNGNIPDESCFTNSPNCYALLAGGDCCFLSGRLHNFKWSTGANKPVWNGQGDVIGCGILMSSANKMFIFFTLNGILLGLLFLSGKLRIPA
jgi:hypothetical protein